MAASAVGPPSGVAAIFSASLGSPQFEATYSAKLANLRASNITPRPVGARPSRPSRIGPLAEERSQTRLFNADAAYTERDALPLASKTAFADYLEDPVSVMHGDLIPYHMPDTVVSGVDDNVAIVVDLISRAGGYVGIYKALEFIGSMNYTVNIPLEELTKPCVFSYSFAAVPSHT